MQKYINELNPEQQKAATHKDGPMLILAGAGSGKTKTITVRTAYLISEGVPGRSILTLTFTNKAANEMKERGMKILESYDEAFSIPEFTTFHSWALKFLKSNISYLEELNEDFTILDENTVKSIIKKIMKDFNMDNEEWKHIKDKNILSLFTIIQNNLIPYDYEDDTLLKIEELFNNKKSRNFFIRNNIETKKELRLISKIYFIYKSVLRENNAVDFDDLINLSVKILSENSEVKDYIREKYNYIMVDEFQDTNYAQIKLLDLITNTQNNICVVGDDSQAIYGWRGADIEHILTFHTRFENTKIVNLHKNYRSTETIVGKANCLLENAKEKHNSKETLSAFRKDNGKIELSKVTGKLVFGKFKSAETIETENVTNTIEKLLESGVKPEDIAILYRTNDISRAFEAPLLNKKIPYQIYKGRNIMEKKVVQEIISLIEFIINKDNSINLERFLTSNAKILTVKKISELLDEIKKPLSEIFNKRLYKKAKTTAKQIDKLEKFMNFVDFARNFEGDIEDLTNSFFSDSILYTEYQEVIKKSKSEKTIESAESAINDFEWFIVLINKYKTLREFYDEMILISETEIPDENKIKLMTVHASKGLEFGYVFLVRFNNDVFPSYRSIVERNLEEERRLAYVAITRAKTHLYISYLDKIYGKDALPSIFIKEAGLIEFERRKRVF